VYALHWFRATQDADSISQAVTIFLNNPSCYLQVKNHPECAQRVSKDACGERWQLELNKVAQELNGVVHGP
jgi:hypothetical protein